MIKITNQKTKNALIIAYLCFSILSFALVLIIPASRDVFKKLSSEHAILMGFIKFALLATAGELIAVAIVKGELGVPVKIVFRFLIWGLIGMWITLMMKVYSTASVYLMGIGFLPGGDSAFLRALYTSILMNTTFGPTFMAVHKITDKILELKADKKAVNLDSIVSGINWKGFFGFTIAKTVPLFWIPAHTVTFMLPSEYQVMMAAGLSVALGIILSLGNRKKVSKEK